MKSFSIWENGEIKLNGDILKEVPEEIREAVSYFTKDGERTIEAQLFSDGIFTFRINGASFCMPHHRYADPHPKYYEIIKKFLEK